MKSKYYIIIIICMILLLASCTNNNLNTIPTPTASPGSIPSVSPTPSVTVTATPTPTGEPVYISKDEMDILAAYPINTLALMNYLEYEGYQNMFSSPEEIDINVLKSYIFYYNYNFNVPKEKNYNVKEEKIVDINENMVYDDEVLAVKQSKEEVDKILTDAFGKDKSKLFFDENASSENPIPYSEDSYFFVASDGPWAEIKYNFNTPVLLRENENFPFEVYYSGNAGKIKKFGKILYVSVTKDSSSEYGYIINSIKFV